MLFHPSIRLILLNPIDIQMEAFIVELDTVELIMHGLTGVVLVGIDFATLTNQVEVGFPKRIVQLYH